MLFAILSLISDVPQDHVISIFVSFNLFSGVRVRFWVIRPSITGQLHRICKQPSLGDLDEVGQESIYKVSQKNQKNPALYSINGLIVPKSATCTG